MILLFFISISIIVLILYHRTKYARRIPDYWKGGSTLRLTLFYALRSILFLVIWPALLVHYLNEKFGPIHFNHRERKHSKHLYFSRCSGAGLFECKDCGYQEKIISGIHHLRGGKYKIGYQCQKCGKFYSILGPSDHDKLTRCYCGGKLSKDKPLFCSKCGIRNGAYHLEYLT
jgi:hypothetical protein